jgi:hypothetical protein
VICSAPVFHMLTLYHLARMEGRGAHIAHTDRAALTVVAADHVAAAVAGVLLLRLDCSIDVPVQYRTWGGTCSALGSSHCGARLLQWWWWPVPDLVTKKYPMEARSGRCCWRGGGQEGPRCV